MAAEEPGTHRVGRPGDVERTAAVVERIRENLLMALREGYSIVIMAPLSLVIAAFSQNVAPDAVPYAVGAATSFLAAVVLTILHKIRRTARAVVHIEIGSARVVAIVAGLAMLGVVIAEFALVPRFDVTLRIIAMVLGTITLVAFGTLGLPRHEALDRLRGDPAAGAPTRTGSGDRRLGRGRGLGRHRRDARPHGAWHRVSGMGHRGRILRLPRPCGVRSAFGSRIHVPADALSGPADC